ncbi:MAG: DUF4394 domain-containing protein [Acidobacteria bacterium]|nr:DUF4394 domain-containing protein [Acidobacteriota bacterium]
MKKFYEFAAVTIALVLAMCIAFPASAANQDAMHPTGVLHPVKIGTSPVLRDLPVKTGPVQLEPGTAERELNPLNAELPENILKAKPVPAGEDTAVQRTYGPNAMPAPIVNFEGIGNIDGVLPPDTNGDVGTNYYVQWVNLSFAIFNKSDGSIAAGPFAGNSLWSGFGGSCESNNSGDPIVLYDRAAGRWFMSQFTGDNHQCIAVSTTGDPTGTWYLYDYLMDAGMGDFPDYPKFGVWPDGYYYTANMFGSSFDGAMAAVFERDKMLNGDPAQMVYFYTADSSSFPSFSMLPADLDGLNPPPAGAPNPIVEMVDDAFGYSAPYNKDELVVMPLHVDWTTPANSTFGPAEIIDLTAAGYPFDSNMCGYSRNCIPQPGTSQGLDTLSSRLMYRLQYRNFGSYQTLVTSHTVDENGSDHAGVRWYELRNTGSGWSVNQAGTYAPDSENRWMGNAAMDASGDIAVGYSVSSSTVYPSIRWAGRLAGDPAGTLGQGEATVIAGGGAQTHSAARWGDYSAMSVDPTDDCTFWYTQEYIATTGSAPWKTRIASFKFPSCSTGPIGTIQGTVTDSSTGDPIGGASVAFVSTSASFSTTTEADGTYTITIPVDTYDITASKFAYVSQTVTGIVLGDGDVITQDFALDEAPTGAVDGYVTGADRGWPLYAKVEVKMGATTVATVFTSPFTGYYSLELPAGTTYTFTATSMISGYLPGTTSVALTAAGQIVSFALSSDGTGNWMTCHLENGVDESFEGSFPPSGWKSVDNSGSGHAWARNDELGAPNRTPGSGYSAAADPSAAGGGAWDTTLYSPEIVLPATPALGVQFNSNFQDYAGNGDAWFEISSDGGATWTTLWYSSSDDPSGGLLRQFDLSAYAGMTIQLRWHYMCSGATAWYWQIDDVQTYALPPPPPAPVESEDFESWVPTSWSTVNNAGCGTWESTATTGRTNYTGGSGYAADADSDWCGSAMDTDLISPVYDFSSQSEVWVEFKYYFNYYASGDQATFDYSTDGGATWTNVYTLTADTSGTFLQDMSSALARQSQVQFRWNYTAAGWDWYYEIDDFAVYDQDPSGGAPPTPTPQLVCEPVGGAFVEGFINDANTTNAINGASVVTDNGSSATSADTPDDPGLPGGFYWMFVPVPVGNGPATRTITASYTGYADASVQINLVPDAVNRVDLALPAGWLELTPANLKARLYAGQTENQTLSFLNHGGVDANVQLIPIPIAATWPHSAPFIDTRNLPGNTEPKSTGRAPHAAGPRVSARNTGLTLAGVPAFAVDVYPDSTLVSWPDVTDPGTWNTVSGGMAPYFGGDFLLGDFSKLYVVDYNTNNFATVDTATGAQTVIGTATPGSGESWSGMTGAVDGTLYASATTCSASTLYKIDPATGTVTTIGTITNAPCVIDIAINAAGELYGIDIVNDNLVRIDPATGAGTVVGSLGVSANYAQGLDFDEVTGTLYWAAYTTQGELRIIDTTTGASTLVGAFPGGAEVDSFAIASTVGASLPWLTLTPQDGLVPAAGVDPGELPIDAQFIADGADHYGLYQATINVIQDTPYQVNPVQVCFTKAFNDMAPGAFADAYVDAVAGVRITTGCGGGNFCPSDPMTRGVMALWLEKAMHGADYAVPPCQGIFADVPCESTPNAPYIEALYDDGITAGCATNPLRYCPERSLTRAEMAVFLLKASQGSNYTPPSCAGTFDDVACPGSFAADWIEDLYARGITAGCSATSFCPSAVANRDQMAVFVTKAFDLPMCPF